MKTKLFSASLILSILLIYGCRKDVIDNEYLEKVLSNLHEIKSARYFSTISASAPDDTSRFVTYDRYMVEYFNQADTFIGSTFAWFQARDTSKLYFYYDGLAKCYIDDDIKTIEIDSFKTNTLPFRPLTPPFFNYLKSIIKYTLETDDSITTNWQQSGDTLLFSLSIYNDKQIEFFGHPFYIDNPYVAENQISRYDIWISKSNGLPFQYRRKMSTNTSWETINKKSLNDINIENFKPSMYFPSDYAIAIRGNVKS